MIFAYPNIAKTVLFGPVLDSAGAEYTSAVVGDVKISKNGATAAALSSSASLIHSSCGVYALTLASSDVSEVGNIQVFLSKTTYTAPIQTLNVYPMLPGTVTNTAFTPTTTQFEALDISTATSNFYNGRVLVFTSGSLAQQQTDITAYQKVGSYGRFTVTALTGAPSNGDTFLIV